MENVKSRPAACDTLDLKRTWRRTWLTGPSVAHLHFFKNVSPARVWAYSCSLTATGVFVPSLPMNGCATSVRPAPLQSLDAQFEWTWYCAIAVSRSCARAVGPGSL